MRKRFPEALEYKVRMPAATFRSNSGVRPKIVLSTVGLNDILHSEETMFGAKLKYPFVS